MRNYSLLRFLKLNVYFFLMYSLLTAVWYGITGKFEENPTGTIGEVFFTAAVFSLLFSLAIVIWFRREERRIPVKGLSVKELDKKLARIGYQRVQGKSKQTISYKPEPPKASALAGKIFVQQSVNFYHLHGPARYLKQIGNL
ncbi:hypothetical protein H7F15_07245 [Pontibacter sp. Tf4]|uniref:hypothetical protein n=1 Tax=Pontibacter sp. Tf4 TaxID=2761620 RepID=UPI0016249BF4|nr:hypothetical protein [Pontibacter sp. Tf4]MBB6610827.1 hypothetical protein [Pontibacter sp. Tf4]